MKFIIDRSKWRTGRDSQFKTGLGETLLLNREGYMCCIGQIACQLGATPDEILNQHAPSNCNDKTKYKFGSILLSKNNENSSSCNNSFSSCAMALNDDCSITRQRREWNLIGLGYQHGHKIEFINEYKELENESVGS